VIRDRNRSRPAPVPDTVIDRLIDKWESPDLTEAHAVHWFESATNSGGRWIERLWTDRGARSA
jgi:hypothetical protein